MKPAIYDAFAPIYERHWNDYSAVILSWFPELLRHFGVNPKSVLDLACGTGAFAVGLAGKEFSVWGLDFSESMLALARRKAEEADVAVEWLCADIREFDLPTSVDMVTCWFDSLNYLTEEDDLRRTFANVQRTLRPDGVFAFDMNTIRGLADHWNTRTLIVVNDEDCFVVTDTTYWDENRANTLELHGFVRRKRGYERVHEVHVQRAYHIADVVEWLQHAGFTDVRAFKRRDFSTATEQDFRAYFFARRPSSE